MIAGISYQLYGYITRTYESVEKIREHLSEPLGIQLRSVKAVDAALEILDHCRYNRMTDRLIGAVLKADNKAKDQLGEALSARSAIGVRIVADDLQVIQNLRQTAIKWGATIDFRDWQDDRSGQEEEYDKPFHCKCDSYILVLHKRSTVEGQNQGRSVPKKVYSEYAEAYFHGLSTYVLTSNDADYYGIDTILNLQAARWSKDTIRRCCDMEMLYSSFDEIVAGESNTYRLALGTLASDRAEQNVIISYAGTKREDQVDKIREQLKGLNLEVVLWDRQGSGMSPEEMDGTVKSAMAALMLVSATYISNENVRTYQLPKIGAARKKSGLKVIRLVMSPCNYDHLEEVKSAESYVDGDKPLKQLSVMHRQEIFAKIARDIASRDRSGRERKFAQESAQASSEKRPVTSAPKVAPRQGVFISYAHKDDQSWLDTLLSYLSWLQRDHGVKIWSDRDIEPGERWHERIQAELDRAKVAVLLVSQDFLASEYISNDELPRMLQAAESDGMTIFWIPVRPSTYKRSPIHAFLSAHAPEKPLSGLSDAERDQAFVDIGEKLAKVLGLAAG